MLPAHDDDDLYKNVGFQLLTLFIKLELFIYKDDHEYVFIQESILIRLIMY